jgi:hypothetical protein
MSKINIGQQILDDDINQEIIEKIYEINKSPCKSWGI